MLSLHLRLQIFQSLLSSFANKVVISMGILESIVLLLLFVDIPVQVELVPFDFTFAGTFLHNKIITSKNIAHGWV